MKRPPGHAVDGTSSAAWSEPAARNHDVEPTAYLGEAERRHDEDDLELHVEAGECGAEERCDDGRS